MLKIFSDYPGTDTVIVELMGERFYTNEATMAFILNLAGSNFTQEIMSDHITSDVNLPPEDEIRVLLHLNPYWPDNFKS